MMHADRLPMPHPHRDAAKLVGQKLKVSAGRPLIDYHQLLGDQELVNVATYNHTVTVKITAVMQWRNCLFAVWGSGKSRRAVRLA